MHGIIFSELKQFAEARYGAPAWASVVKEAGLSGKMYLPIAEYPDGEAMALVTTAARITGKPVPALLEDFGEFIAPHLVKMYASLVKPEWKTLDVIENTEATMHRVVRMKNPGAKPPELRTSRPGPNEIILTYGSARKMCGVAKGIVKGLALQHGEKITITEKSCMHSGAAACVMSIRKE